MEKSINKGEKNIKEKKGKTRNGGEKIMSTGDEIIKNEPEGDEKGRNDLERERKGHENR